MSNGKQRHGCLTAWLIFILLSNSVVTLLYLYWIGTNFIFSGKDADASRGFLLILTIAGIFNVICVLALFNWKKWGFYGFIASSIAAFIINLSMGLSIIQSLTSLIGIAILYGVLQIGADNKGWTQLK